MSNEPIEPIEQNYVPFNELFPSVVQGGIEVKDDLIDSNNTYSSEKIENRLGEVTSSLTQAIEDIDLSPYATTQALTDGLGTKQDTLGYTAENQANKNSASGYLGLNDISRIDSIFRVIQKNKYGFYHNFLNYFFNSTNVGIRSSSTSGSGAFSNVGSNGVKLKSTLSGAWLLPTAYLGANATGTVVLDHGATNIRLDSTSKIQIESCIATRLTAKQSSLIFGLGTFSISGSFWSGNGVLFIHDPTQNSGNWRVGKVLSGSFTPASLSISLSNETAIRLRIYYNKTTEIATFYINDILVYTLNSVNLGSTTVYSIVYGLDTTDNTESTIRALSVAYHALEIEI